MDKGREDHLDAGQIEQRLRGRGLQITPTSAAGYLVTDQRCNLAAGCKPNMSLAEIAAWLERPVTVQAKQAS